MFDAIEYICCLRARYGTDAHAAQIKSGPELESTNESMAIIRWTTTNPGGTDLHYGMVHYGTDAVNLSQVAKSPNRRNASHQDMIFRVRIAGLNPQTTYYYTVESTGAMGANDGVVESSENVQNEVVQFLLRIVRSL